MITEFLQGISGGGGTEGGSPVPPVLSKDHSPPEPESDQFVPSKARKKKARQKMSARAKGDHLLVKFADDKMERWKLPDRADKETIRRVRDLAVAFARDHGATLGQINAVKKALTDEGYYVTNPKRPLK